MNIAVVPQPPRKSRLVADAPILAEAPNNLLPIEPAPPKLEEKPAAPPQEKIHKSDLYVDLNFKVDEAFRILFKMTATAWRMSNKEFVEIVYKEWVERHGERRPTIQGARAEVVHDELPR